jgi:hypothetical protein
MFLRTKVFRRKDGSTRTYLELVANRRVDGHVRQQVIAHLGRLDQLQPEGVIDRLMAGLARFSQEQWLRLAALHAEQDYAYGAALVFRRLWEDLGLAEALQQAFATTEASYPGEEAVFAMVLNRILEPYSKRGTHAWLDSVYRPQWRGLDLHHLYRALDVLHTVGPRLEELLFARIRDLFHLDLSLVLFDTTSTYFWGEGPEGLAKYGYSRDHRPDLRQMVVGLLMTGEGIPICHRVFPGNRVDAAAFQEIVAELKPRLGLQRVVLVGDRGLVSEQSLGALDLARQDYILGLPLRRYQAARRVLARAGRYHQVAENLRVKETWLEGDRYIICYNPEAAERDRARREQIVARLEQRLAQGGVKALLKSPLYRRFLRVTGETARLDRTRVEQDARLDGKWVLFTNTTIPSDEVALAYKGLWRVERAFRHLKSGLEVRPVFHWTEERVRGHVLVCFLALVLESALQRRLGEQHPELSYSQVLRDLERMRAVEVEAEGQRYLLRTELAGGSHTAFAVTGLRPPPHLQLLD